MSYCKNYGNQLKDDSKFCSKCGVQQSLSISNNQSYSSPSSWRANSGDSGNLLLKTGYSNKLLTRNILFIIIGIIYLALIYIILDQFISQNNNTYSYGGGYKHSESSISFLKLLCSLCAIEVVVHTIMRIIRCIQIKNNYLNITEEGIYGVACPSFGFGTLNFNVQFNQITSVVVKSGRIIFTTTFDNKKYYCCVEDYTTAINIINNKVFRK